jgi:hypothetical protein
MRRSVWLSLGIAIVLAMGAGRAQAQWGYPGGWGGYGWSNWGQNPSDPNAGFMTALGSFARGRGAYEVDDAKARAINVDTMLKWNKALREYQHSVEAEQAEQDAAKRARDSAIAERESIERGTSLNDVLDQIFEFNPNGSKAYAAQTPISPALLRDIPFESRSEAITFSLDEMTSDEGWPDALEAESLAPERRAVQQAVDDALREDAHGEVSNRTARKVTSTIGALRGKYTKDADQATVEYAEADEFLKTLSSLTRVLRNPHLQKVVAGLENYEKGDLGDLIAFMSSFNLRFGPAVSDRQKSTYRMLYPMLVNVRDEARAPIADRRPPVPARAAAGKAFQRAARDTFKGMEWRHIDAQDRADQREQ